MKLVFVLVVMTSFNHTLSETIYAKMSDCLDMQRKIQLPYLASCLPRTVLKSTQAF